MNAALLLKAITGMAERITLEDFSSLSGIRSILVATDVVEFLLASGVGRRNGTTLYFSGSDRVETAILAIRMGCDPEATSIGLTWRDFEELASKILASIGYKTRTNVRLKKPRMEIDVVGIDRNFALALDCKHWKRSDLSAISVFCDRQIARVEELIKREQELEQAVPAILTLHDFRIASVNRVPVIPVSKLDSFLLDIQTFLPDLCVVKRQGST